jgi:hypothetical protein
MDAARLRARTVSAGPHSTGSCKCKNDMWRFNTARRVWEEMMATVPDSLKPNTRSRPWRRVRELFPSPLQPMRVRVLAVCLARSSLGRNLRR